MNTKKAVLLTLLTASAIGLVACGLTYSKHKITFETKADTITNLTNTTWQFNDAVTRPQDVDNGTITYTINFELIDYISLPCEKIRLTDNALVYTGFTSTQAANRGNTELNENTNYYYFRAGTQNNYYRKIKIINGSDVQNANLIQWITSNATQLNEYTISFNANGGTGTMTSQTVYNGNYNLPESTFTAPQYKTFYAWAVNSIDGTQYTPNTEIYINQNTTLYAIWVDTQNTVTFNANGGTGTMANTTCNNTFIAPQCLFTAPTGYIFSKWALNSIDGPQYAVGETIENIGNDITLYALWQDYILGYWKFNNTCDFSNEFENITTQTFNEINVEYKIQDNPSKPGEIAFTTLKYGYAWADVQHEEYGLLQVLQYKSNTVDYRMYDQDTKWPKLAQTILITNYEQTNRQTITTFLNNYATKVNNYEEKPNIKNLANTKWYFQNKLNMRFILGRDDRIYHIKWSTNSLSNADRFIVEGNTNLKARWSEQENSTDIQVYNHNATYTSSNFTSEQNRAWYIYNSEDVYNYTILWTILSYGTYIGDIPQVNYVGEYIDIPNLMLKILSMPFTFITQAFDVTLWPGTPYAFNFSNFIKGIIAIGAILFIIRLFTNGFSIIGNYTNDAQDSRLNRKLTKAKIEKTQAQTNLANRTDPNVKTKVNYSVTKKV